MPKIFDTFPFFNEIEILELRFMEMYDFVDYFVIVEANKTHNGTPKEFIFEKEKSRYKKWLDKVIYVKVEDMPEYDPNEVFKLEYYQRDQIMRGLKDNAQPGDKILVSDCDEIPNVEELKKRINDKEWIVCKQTLFYYFVNNKARRNWAGTVMADYGTFGDRPQRLRFFAIRHTFDRSPFQAIQNGGWHYSYMTGGDAKRIRDKVSLFAEKCLVDLMGSEEEVAKKIKNQKDIFGREEEKPYYNQEIVDISNNKPKMLDKWLEKYPLFIYKENENLL